MKIFRYLLFFLIITSCKLKKDDCNLDKKFEAFYYFHLKGVTDYYENRTYENEGRLLTSIIYFKVITDIGSHVKADFFVRYDSVGFVKDTTAWKKWYRENKCTMTMEKADKILRDHKLR